MGDDPDMSQIQTMCRLNHVRRKLVSLLSARRSARRMAMSASTSKDMNTDVASLTSYVVVHVAASPYLPVPRSLFRPFLSIRTTVYTIQ
jgi:hypothetical protein